MPLADRGGADRLARQHRPSALGPCAAYFAHASGMGGGACSRRSPNPVTFAARPGSSAFVSEAYSVLPGDAASGLLVVVDHASRAIPADIDLGIDPGHAEKH